MNNLFGDVICIHCGYFTGMIPLNGKSRPDGNGGVYMEFESTMICGGCNLPAKEMHIENKDNMALDLNNSECIERANIR